MWYEILPSFGIITAAVTAPQIFNYFLQKFTQDGNPYKRDLVLPYNLNLYRRDVRLSGNTYKAQGLDNIPDED